MLPYWLESFQPTMLVRRGWSTLVVQRRDIPLRQNTPGTEDPMSNSADELMSSLERMSPLRQATISSAIGALQSPKAPESSRQNRDPAG